MSYRNRDDVFIDTRLLRDHASKFNKQRRIALELYECVKSMKRLSEPAEAYKYNSILRDVEQMVNYFSRMVTVFDQIEYEALGASRKIAAIIDNDTERTRHINSKTFML